MKLSINGRPIELAPGTTVDEILEMLGYPAECVAVAIGLECVPRSRYARTELHENDQVEILSPHQGG